MKIYIAARHELRRKARRVADGLEDAGHRVVARWIRGPGLEHVGAVDAATFALTDVLAADCVVLIAESAWQDKSAPGAGEPHVEFGYALKAGKRLCVLGPRQTSFCALPAVGRYRTVKDLVDGLR